MKRLITILLLCFATQAQAQWYGFVGPSFVNSEESVTLGAGYRLSKYFAVEGAYLGRADVANNHQRNQSPPPPVVETSRTWTLEGARLSLVLSKQLAPRWSAEALAGVYYLKGELEEIDSTGSRPNIILVDSRKMSGDSLNLGAGLGISFIPSKGVRAKVVAEWSGVKDNTFGGGPQKVDSMRVVSFTLVKEF